MGELREATCGFCHTGIRVKVDDDGNEGAWFHVSGLVKGCRAASRDSDGRYDQSLGRSWKAQPEPGTQRPFAFIPCLTSAESPATSRLHESGNCIVSTWQNLTKDGDHAISSRNYRTVGTQRFFWNSCHLAIDGVDYENPYAEIMEIPEDGADNDAVSLGVRLRSPGIYLNAMQGVQGSASHTEGDPAWHLDYWHEPLSPERASEIMAACLVGASEGERVRAEMTPDRWAVEIRHHGKPPGGMRLPCESKEAADQLAREKHGQLVHCIGTDEATARRRVRMAMQEEAERDRLPAPAGFRVAKYQTSKPARERAAAPP